LFADTPYDAVNRNVLSLRLNSAIDWHSFNSVGSWLLISLEVISINTTQIIDRDSRQTLIISRKNTNYFNIMKATMLTMLFQTYTKISNVVCVNELYPSRSLTNNSLYKRVN